MKVEDFDSCYNISIENKINFMQKIKVQTIVNTDIQKAWKHWNDAESIKGWAFASSDWECLYAENSLMVEGRFLTRMSAKDKSVSFDFTGT